MEEMVLISKENYEKFVRFADATMFLSEAVLKIHNSTDEQHIKDYARQVGIDALKIVDTKA